jgi:hypothetical protein
MKNSLLSFVCAFALAAAFTLLSLISRASLSVLLTGNVIESLSNNTLLSILLSLLGLAIFFGVFYFLGENFKIYATKSTVLASLLGVMLAPAFLYIFNIFLYQPYSDIYFALAAGSAVSGIFQFFFPALTGLLFAELRKSKSTIVQQFDT